LLLKAVKREGAAESAAVYVVAGLFSGCFLVSANCKSTE
jgi:hypothetical protein